MPSITDLAKQQSALGQQAGLGSLESLMSGWDGGSLGTGLFSGMVSNAASKLNKLDRKGLTIDDILKAAKNIPLQKGQDLKLAIQPKFKLSDSPTSPIVCETVTVPSDVVYMISAGNIYSFNGVAVPITAQQPSVSSISWPVTASSQSNVQQLDWPYTFGTGSISQTLINYQAHLNWIMQVQTGSITGGYTGECNTTPMTPEQRDAWVKAEAERAAKKSAAMKRAEGLLFTILRPEQIKQYQDHEYFETEIDDRVYRIRKGHSGNILVMKNGKAIESLCVHPVGCYETPEVDTMISQLLMLRTDEARLLKTANRTRLM